MSIYNIALYAALAAVCGLFAAGLYQFALILLKVPSSRTTKAIKAVAARNRPTAAGFKNTYNDISLFVSRFIRLNEFKKKELADSLKIANISMSPELFTARALVRSAGIMLLSVPFFFFLPIIGLLVIVLAVRKKRPLLLLTGAGMLLSLVLLSFVQGRYSPYRTCQVFALFVALAGLAVYELLRRAAARRAVLLGSVQLLAVLLCLHQAMYLNHLLAVDYQRSEQEAAVVRTLGTELVRDYGTDKPVVLVGRYTLGENITRYTTADPMQHPLYRFFREHTSWESGDTVKYVETNCNSVLNWSITAFSEVDDVYGQAAEHLFRYYGFALDMTHSAALHEQAQTYADAHDLPGYPRTGAIVDCGDYVLVNLQ